MVRILSTAPASPELYSKLTFTMDFGISIGEMALGVPPKIPVDEVVEAVKTVDKTKTEVKLAAETLKTLGKCVDSINKLWPAIKEAAESLRTVEENGDVSKVAKISEVTGGGADTGTIGAVAAWDKWILDCDLQLETAVSSGIAGAGKYRVELRKHAIDSKALIQAKVETIRAGQEYIVARMDQSLSEFDVKKLGELKNCWEMDKQVDEQAAAHFFDRFLSLRTSIVMEMRNILWAYKYKALEDSKVHLSVMKTEANDYLEDLAIIRKEDNSYLTNYPRKYRKYCPLKLAYAC